MINLYMDVQVQAQITRALRRRGVNVLTAQEDGQGETPDDQLLDRATQLGRLLFSRDQDLLREAALRQARGETFGGVIYARMNAVPLKDCIEGLELIALIDELERYANRVQYLPL